MFYILVNLFFLMDKNIGIQKFWYIKTLLSEVVTVSGVIGSRMSSRVVDHEFYPHSGKMKEYRYKIGICLQEHRLVDSRVRLILPIGATCLSLDYYSS
jgi:hypothetical protein